MWGPYHGYVPLYFFFLLMNHTAHVNKRFLAPPSEQLPLFVQPDFIQHSANKENGATPLPFDPATMDQLQTMHEHNIAYGIYSGTQVAYLTGTRPYDDVDVFIGRRDYAKVHRLLGGRAYDVQPYMWPKGCLKKPVSFIAVGNMEIKAGSDGVPGHFTFTPFVRDNLITVNEAGQRMSFVSPTETFLFKVALWREKDQKDVASLLQMTGLIDLSYLRRRLQETRTANRLRGRLTELLGFSYDIT